MSFEVKDFGRTSAGEQVRLYTLKNSDGTEAVFTDLGAAWVSMKVADKNGNFDDVIFGYDTPEIYEKNPTSCGECIGRTANRTGNAAFMIDGVKYRIAKNDNGINNLHSGPDYWKSRVFSAGTEESKLGSKVTFSLFSKDMDQGYPGNLSFSVSYTLKEDNSVSIEYKASSDRTTLCNPTNHCYFNPAGHGSGSILDQEVWINADSYTPTDRYSIPDGRILPVAGTPMDFTVMKPIGEDIGADFEPLKFGNGYDHNYVLNQYDGKIRLVAKAADKKTGRILKVYTDLPGMQFYCGNSLKSQAPGKGGADYAFRTGYCFETQFYPDAVNKPEWPSPLLKKGEEYHHYTIYKFGV